MNVIQIQDTSLAIKKLRNVRRDVNSKMKMNDSVMHKSFYNSRLAAKI